ncbi:MAG: hypothetical protein ACRCZY_00960 [Phocaeicola sp.]
MVKGVGNNLHQIFTEAYLLTQFCLGQDFSGEPNFFGSPEKSWGLLLKFLSLLHGYTRIITAQL